MIRKPPFRLKTRTHLFRSQDSAKSCFACFENNDFNAESVTQISLTSKEKSKMPGGEEIFEIEMEKIQGGYKRMAPL